MKYTINSILKLAIVTVLFCSAAFADGDMSNGGRSCTGANCPTGFAAGSNSGQKDTRTTVSGSDSSVLDNQSFSETVEEFLTAIGLI